MQFHYPTGLARFLPIAIAALGISATAVTAAQKENVSVFLRGKQIGIGKRLQATSRNTTIAPSKAYDFKLDATCFGTGDLAPLIPPNTPFLDLIELIAPGKSKLFKGTIENPTGTLPLVLVSRKLSASRTFPGLGKVSISFKATAKIAANGQIVVDGGKILVKGSTGKYKGTIRFEKGSEFNVSAAPEIEFKRVAQNVLETAGSVRVLVVKGGDPKRAGAVSYTTVDDTATAGDDYTAKSGVVRFKKGQTKKFIKIPIINQTPDDFFRKFSIELSDPKFGAVLGKRTTGIVNILNE